MALTDHSSDTHGSIILDALQRLLGGLREMTALGKSTKRRADLADQIFERARQHEEFSLFPADRVAGREIFLIGDQRRGLADNAAVFDNLSGPVRAVATLEQLSDHIRRRGASRAIAVVDIDSYDTAQQAVDTLCAFRRRFPALPVVIGSYTFAQNDFGQERAPIADASLRLPASALSLALSVGAAISNNSFRQREH